MTGLSPMGASAINDSGQVTGVCGPNPGTQACMDSNGSITLLPDPSNFTAINCGPLGDPVPG